MTDSAVPCSGPEGSGLAEEAAAGHRALQVTAQLPQPLGSVRRLHPGRAHQPGAARLLAPCAPAHLSPASPCCLCACVCPSSSLPPCGWSESPGSSFMQPARLAWPHLQPCGDFLLVTPPRSPPPLQPLQLRWQNTCSGQCWPGCVRGHCPWSGLRRHRGVLGGLQGTSPW